MFNGLAAEATRLKPVQVQRKPHRDHLALPDQSGGGGQLLRADVVQRAALVLLTPPPPVRVLLDVVPDHVVTGKGDDIGR